MAPPVHVSFALTAGSLCQGPQTEDLREELREEVRTFMSGTLNKLQPQPQQQQQQQLTPPNILNKLQLNLLTSLNKLQPQPQQQQQLNLPRLSLNKLPPQQQLSLTRLSLNKLQLQQQLCLLSLSLNKLLPHQQLSLLSLLNLTLSSRITLNTSSRTT